MARSNPGTLGRITTGCCHVSSTDDRLIPLQFIPLSIVNEVASEQGEVDTTTCHGAMSIPIDGFRHRHSDLYRQNLLRSVRSDVSEEIRVRRILITVAVEVLQSRG
jgi:hypothetical protein